MKRLLFCICILVGIQINANAQIVNSSGNSFFGFSEITRYGNSAKRAIIYSTKPRTVKFKVMAMGFNGGGNVIGYFKAGSSYTNTTGDWQCYITNNATTYHTVNLQSGRNYIELGLHVYFSYSAPQLIMWVEDCSPRVINGEGEPGSHSGMDNALSVSVY